MFSNGIAFVRTWSLRAPTFDSSYDSALSKFGLAALSFVAVRNSLHLVLFAVLIFSDYKGWVIMEKQNFRR
jgi:hypothetical protein